MEINLDNVDFVYCVALFYKKGKTGRDYIVKEPFRIALQKYENGKAF